MNERVMQFRIGMFVIVAGLVLTMLVVWFGESPQLFRDHGHTLPRALEKAHDRAWQALGVALAGNGLCDRIRVFFASGDDKGIREQVAAFLQANATSFDGTPAEVRRACLKDLQRLRKSGLLATAGLPGHCRRRRIVERTQPARLRWCRH